jgi:hypothetical protein
MKENLMRSALPGRLRLFSLALSPALWACLAAATAHAQDAAILHQNTFEVGPFGGISYGVDNIRGMGGLNATYSVLPNLLVYGEYSYFPSIDHTATDTADGARYDFKIPIQDINFGVHLRIRIPKTPLVPYAVVGVGLLHSESTTDFYLTQNPFTGAYSSPNSYTVNSSTSFAVDYGAGVRWYIRENFGLRGEFKAYRLTGGPLHDPSGAGVSGGLGVNQIYRATLGFFFQF